MWIVAAVLLLVVVSGFTTMVVIRSTSSSASAPAPADPAGPGPAGTNAPDPSTGRTAGSAPADPAPTEVAAAAEQLPVSPTVIVLDASGSMNVDDAPGPRIDAAKRAVATLVDSLPEGAPMGLLVFGTSTGGSDAEKPAGCQDIRTLIGLGPLDRVSFGSAVAGVQASGYTPLAAALRAASDVLPEDGPRNVVLVSDGIDQCAPPESCAVAAELADPELSIHTVGFRVDEAARNQLGCIADAAGGTYVDADNAAQLGARLRSAIDPNTAVNTLTRTGFGGLELGMTVEDAKAVDPAIGAESTGTVQIIWRDCELTFTDGKLTGIGSTTTVGTQDGLAVGDDAGRAVELYGAGTVESGTDGSARLLVPTGGRGETGYDITFVPEQVAAGTAAGRITRIILCLCRPPEPAPADADAQVDAARDPATGGASAAGGTPAADVPGSDVLGPAGYGPLKIGMTLEQARAADPSIVETFNPPCVHATASDGSGIMFNPDGGLSMITPPGDPAKPEGLRVGDTVERAYQLYAPGQPRELPENPSAVSFPVTAGSPIEYWIFFRRSSEGDDDANNATIRKISLNRDQQCVN